MAATKVKRVAVVGAGVSGLLSTKSCLECGMEPVCFERTNMFGGLWQTPELPNLDGIQGGSVYKCLITNSSKEMMAISDFPFPKDYPPYLTPKHLLAYYRNYVSHFKLDEHIRLGTEVSNIRPSDDHDSTGRWIVTSRPSNLDKTAAARPEASAVTETFDAVMVCTGVFSKAFLPTEYPGQDEFQGDVLHSNQFRTGAQFEGKTVLVVGSSHSAGDVAVDTSRHAKQVYLSMRDGTWVIGRFGPQGVPPDSFVNRRWRSYVPESVVRKFAKPLFEGRFNLDNLGLRCKRQLFDGYVMVNDDIQGRIVCGSLKCKPAIARFTPRGVVFEDGTKVDGLDAVVFGTGYDLKFPFIEDKSIMADGFADLELYMHVWPVRRKKHSLAAIGMVTALGAQSPTFEVQARWACQVFQGKAHLPEMDSRIADVHRRKQMMFKKFGKHRVFYNPVPYTDEIASKFGATPNMFKLLLTDPALALKCFFGPTYPPTYRVNGPHPWKGAREAIFNGWDNTISPTKTRIVEPYGTSDGALFASLGTRKLMGAMLMFFLITVIFNVLV